MNEEINEEKMKLEEAPRRPLEKAESPHEYITSKVNLKEHL